MIHDVSRQIHGDGCLIKVYYESSVEESTFFLSQGATHKSEFAK